jgi:hypothetical protein
MIKLRLSPPVVMVLLVSLSAPTREGLTVQVHVRHAEWVSCVRPTGIETLLHVVVKNTSSERVKLGRIAIEQERIYLRDGRGRLGPVGTTATPDELPPSVGGDYEDQFKSIQEVTLQTNASKDLDVKHYVYLRPTDLQSDEKGTHVTLSFRVTNVLRDGTAKDFWTEPITVELPQGCRP